MKWLAANFHTSSSRNKGYQREKYTKKEGIVHACASDTTSYDSLWVERQGGESVRPRRAFGKLPLRGHGTFFLFSRSRWCSLIKVHIPRVVASIGGLGYRIETRLRNRESCRSNNRPRKSWTGRPWNIMDDIRGLCEGWNKWIKGRMVILRIVNSGNSISSVVRCLKGRKKKWLEVECNWHPLPFHSLSLSLFLSISLLVSIFIFVSSSLPLKLLDDFFLPTEREGSQAPVTWDNDPIKIMEWSWNHRKKR